MVFLVFIISPHGSIGPLFLWVLWCLPKSHDHSSVWTEWLWSWLHSILRRGHSSLHIETYFTVINNARPLPISGTIFIGQPFSSLWPLAEGPLRASGPTFLPSYHRQWPFPDFLSNSECISPAPYPLKGLQGVQGNSSTWSFECTAKSYLREPGIPPWRAHIQHYQFRTVRTWGHSRRGIHTTVEPWNYVCFHLCAHLIVKSCLLCVSSVHTP